MTTAASQPTSETLIDLPRGHRVAASIDAGMPYALLAEFDTVDSVLMAAKRCTEAGYTRTDVHTPFPIHGMDAALDVKPTILPWIVLAMGLGGMATGLSLTLYTMAGPQGVPLIPVSLEGYQYLISGKPYAALAAYIPVIFELTIMFAAYTAVFAMFLLNRLPMLFNPLFKSPLMKRATDDRFILAIQADDPRFDEHRTLKFLQDQGALSTDLVRD
ncbi:DUF3341 domain-containing protein [Phycisphaera mikurensis]|uniref:DUF3341 domain-containing protein n=1 Tax=Phycisphaera mikurensis (strain NBRC 102666 / KCTC 22515 / FYK2301M01) TaxID=1142394 RepID=I0ICC0_PHYMF|nr:DUF3341 domain-containing protein [Phycisphaera mikurensis]MBB6442215.1 hypothetical protein [Phycisphaera mikurensis]BAM02908.1 hypothetical protein PSMK_07490 [Phycisphaera mikurensis NBRC 102666]